MTRRGNVKRTRRSGKLTFLLKAEKFIDYTLTITNKRDGFPKSVRFTLTNRIVDRSLDIREMLSRANRIYPLNREDALKRLDMQSLAIEMYRDMDFMIRLAHSKKYIKDNELKHWSYLMADARKVATGWHNSDVERYKSLIEGK